jgi:hypothetical protein
MQNIKIKFPNLKQLLISRKPALLKYLLCLVLVAAVALPLVATPITPSFAASEISLGSTVQISFPTAIAFRVNAKSDANITQLRLNYIVLRQNYAKVISEGWPQFKPLTSVNTEWLWDMRKNGLPPGAKIEYWWTAQDAAGKVAETPHTPLSFDDNRYKWQSITTKPVTLYWYEGDNAFANALMTAAQQGLERIENDTGAIPTGTVAIYIYASSDALRGAQLFAAQWEGGVTFGGFSIIAIGVAPNELDYGLTAVPHELTHWAIGQVTFNSYGADLPRWLDEGLATYGEGATSQLYTKALDFAIKNNKLISIRSLSSPFSAVPQTAYISYAESNSVITYLIKTYGKEKMIKLLDTFRVGNGYDAALKQVYGFDQTGLDTEWKKSIGVKTSALPQEYKNPVAMDWLEALKLAGAMP